MNHLPVLVSETIKFLVPQKNENFIDATVGFGGHAEEILKRIGPQGQLLGIDQDQVALEAAKKKLKNYSSQVILVKANFSQIGLLALRWQKPVKGVLLDLGVSSYQIDSGNRGFSFKNSGLLDMRMAPQSQRISAYEIVNFWDRRRLKKLFRDLGEEPMASRITQEIICSRKKEPIQTTDDLVKVIQRAIPAKVRFHRHKHFATNVFRALRMEVNQELEVLESVLKQTKQILVPGGRLVVISFHSLEDRLVKNFFRDNDDLEILTSKPIIPTSQEIEKNLRSRSAKLRAAEKIDIG